MVGALLLAFGSQWYRKGILIVSRDGWATGVGDEDVDDDVPDGFDWTGAFLSFQGCLARGARGGGDRGRLRRRGGRNRLGDRGCRCVVSVVVIGALGAATRYVAAIPRRALQLFVGAMLITFGTFWAGEGLERQWPGGDFALLAVAGCLVRRRRACCLCAACPLAPRGRRWQAG